MKLFYDEKEFTAIESEYRNVYYYCDCCGCLVGKTQSLFCMESKEGDFLVFCKRCFQKRVVPATIKRP